MKYDILTLTIVATLLISGCIGQPNDKVPKGAVPSAQVALDTCIQNCQDAKLAGQNLSNGPCLSENIIDDWVCDVAHSPRQPVDNLPENQCSSFGKAASHFVEVDENCGFIRAV